MDGNKLIKRAGEIAYRYEQEYGGCAQVVIGALKRALEENNYKSINDEVFKAATGLAGGIGLTGNSCGACVGGVMVLSSFMGREYNNFADPEEVRYKSYEYAKELIEKFKDRYGSIKCHHIQEKIMGRKFNLRDEKEFKEFLKAGGHDDKCPDVCRSSAEWVMEIILRENMSGVD